MESILNRNLNFLKIHQPKVYEKLKKYMNHQYTPRDNSIQRILLAKCDEMVVNLVVMMDKKEYMLCNHEEPVQEAYDWITQYIDPTNDVEIVFGMGMAFHLEVLLTSFREKSVIIVEPNIELFHQIIRVRNLESIIKKCEIFLDEDINVILKRLSLLFWNTDKKYIQCEPFWVYAEIFSDMWLELRTKFIKNAQSLAVDVTTRKYFGDTWLHNYIKNLRKISKASDGDALLNKFEKIPGILVSAGPSLSKNMHLLKGLEDKCVIMAAGTAAPILDKNGIMPHFMVSIEADLDQIKMYETIKNREINFLYSNQVAEWSIDNYEGPKFLMNYAIDGYTQQFFEFMGQQREIIWSGPSVANTCFDVLLKMGCDPIVLVGQDFAYTFGNVYADGQEESSLKRDDFDYEKDGYILTKDIYGNDTYTKIHFIAMKNWFEGYFERLKDNVEIINATEGGLNIEFARNDTLENVINSYNFENKDITDTISQIYNSSRFTKEVVIKLNDYEETVRQEIDNLREVINRQVDLINKVSSNFISPSKSKKKTHDAIREIENFTKLIARSPIYDSMLKSIIETEFFLIKIDVQNELDKLDDYQSIKDVLMKASTKQIEILEEKLDKIEGWLKDNI